MTTKKIILNSAQIAVAQRLGISPEVYAKSMAIVYEEEPPEVDGSNPNNVELYNTPIETLRDLWLSKFGRQWVHETILDDGETWELIQYRLREYHMLEDDMTCEWRKLREEV
jgi:hypothetical protein